MGKVKYGKAVKFSGPKASSQPSRKKADLFGKAAQKRVNAFAKKVKI